MVEHADSVRNDSVRNAPDDKSSSSPKKAADRTESERNARLGLWLFAIYLAFYGGFVLISAFATSLLEWTPVAGLNLAVLYGFGLIALALVLALIYGWMCRPGQSCSNSESGK